jgi:hypothetical protein
MRSATVPGGSWINAEYNKTMKRGFNISKRWDQSTGTDAAAEAEAVEAEAAASEAAAAAAVVVVVTTAPVPSSFPGEEQESEGGYLNLNLFPVIPPGVNKSKTQ